MIWTKLRHVINTCFIVAKPQNFDMLNEMISGEIKIPASAVSKQVFMLQDHCGDGNSL